MGTEEHEKPAKKFEDASFSELLSFSKFTLTGVGIFIANMVVIVLLQQLELFTDPNSGLIRVLIGFTGISILIILLGLVIDFLQYRNYSDWGALGAIIAYIGLFIFFLPLILYMISFGDNLLYLIVIIVGSVILIIGFTSRATDLDRKIEALLIILWTEIREFNYKELPTTIYHLLRNLLVGMIEYLFLGLKTLHERTILFFKYLIQLLQVCLKGIWVLLTQTIPQLVIQSTTLVKNNFHFIGISSVILYFFVHNRSNTDFYLDVELFIIIGFFFILGVLYLHKEGVVTAVRSIQSYSWETAISLNEKINNFMSERRTIVCNNCESTIPRNSETCPVCESPVIRCLICKGLIRKGDKIVTCGQCEYTFHENHWNQWRRMGHPCPICGFSDPPTEVIEKVVEKKNK